MSDKVPTSPVEPGTTIDALDIDDIQRMIPHRYPFLMIDRVTDIIAETSAVGIKNVTANEPHFEGHFPAKPVMPGVLIIEAMAQTAAVLVVATLGQEAAGQLVYFMTIDQARFRKPVVPGDQLQLSVTKEQRRLGMWKFKGRATVDGQLVAEATIGAKIMGV
ncbi:MAG: 3-hydroxyacyl-ACP dehydratase FabZ [Alphaproteobacteria bacterium]|nr:3-hydroxyacyl-ACP dehydratase FabZ [Alphaproteobacteria bacterium]